MATEVLVELDDRGKLCGVNSSEQALLDALDPKKSYRAKITAATPRSIRQLRFYWASLDECVENQEFYLASPPLHMWLKHRCGLYSKIIFHDGKVHIELDSTGVEKMEAGPFNDYLDKALHLLCTEICPGMERKRLIEAAERRSGVTYQSLRNGQAAAA